MFNPLRLHVSIRCNSIITGDKGLVSLLLLLLLFAFFTMNLVINDDPGCDGHVTRTIGRPHRIHNRLLSHMDSTVLDREFWRRNISLDDTDREILNHLPRCSQLRRKFLINDVCRLYNVTSSEVGSADYWRLLVNKHVSLIYCSIPKAGCTTLKSLVRYPEMSKDRVAIFRKSIIRNNLDKYQKLLLVRHPFSRLYSAYYDKILLSHLTYPQFYLDIAEKYFPGSTTGGTLNLTFEQFAKLVAYEYKTGAFVNRHWMTQYELCRPCQIRYDYVAKLETMDIDEPAIRAMTKVYGPIQKINSHANASDPKNLWAAYRNVGNDVIERLLQIYEADFRLFGYNWSRDNGILCSDVIYGRVTDGIDMDCCS